MRSINSYLGSVFWFISSLEEKNMSLCEVRIPTYKRPDLLKRSLSSLVKQTYENWQAIILDDSPEQEAKDVVIEFNDDRIIYKPNQKNLGRSKNINYAFLSKSYINGSYACVLEDDNYLLPGFIAENIQSIENNMVGIVLRNQEIRVEKYKLSISTGETTRGQWFEKGIYTPLQIYARLFFCEGISNGGLFWHTDRIKSNLQVSSQVENSWHQELFRTLQIKEKIYFEPKPLCVFTEFYQEEDLQYGILSEIYKKYNSLKMAPKHNRGTQTILNYLVNAYDSSIIEEAQKIAIESGARRTLERQLLNALYLNYKFQELNYFEIARYLSKYFIRYLLFKDHFKKLLTTMT